MYHHDSRPYEEAVSAAAAHGRVKMEEIIHKGLANTKGVVERILSRAIEDRIVKADRFNVFSPNDGTWMIESDGAFSLDLHSHAFGQIVDNAGMPRQFVDHIVKQANGTRWGPELVSHNLKEIFSHRPKQRNLIRSEGPTAKGFLSDKFRRIDSRPLLDAFMGAANAVNLVPIDGIGTDTKSRVRAVLPKVFEPIPNEVMLFGLEWGNSDYGDGGHVVNLWTMRVWCTNLAITTSFLRQVHLGKRLEDNIQYSDETYDLDTKANARALVDVVQHSIGPATINSMLDAIRAANQKQIVGRDGIDKLLKGALSKSELEKVTDIFEGPDVVNLPAGQSKLRLSNALSFFAQAEGISADRKIELQGLAGKFIMPAKAEAAVAV